MVGAPVHGGLGSYPFGSFYSRSLVFDPTVPSGSGRESGYRQKWPAEARHGWLTGARRSSAPVARSQRVVVLRGEGRTGMLTSGSCVGGGDWRWVYGGEVEAAMFNGVARARRATVLHLVGFDGGGTSWGRPARVRARAGWAGGGSVSERRRRRSRVMWLILVGRSLRVELSSSAGQRRPRHLLRSWLRRVVSGGNGVAVAACARAWGHGGVRERGMQGPGCTLFIGVEP